MNPSDPRDEAWLRDALHTVADLTPVPERPAPGVTSLTATRPVDPADDRRRPLWGIVAAAAALIVLIGGTAFIVGQHDHNRVELIPGGPVSSAPVDTTPPVDNSPVVPPTTGRRTTGTTRTASTCAARS